MEVLNDLDGEIVNFYRVCQQHHDELLRYFRSVLVSRKWFDLLRATDPATLTDIQRAARLYAQPHRFGGFHHVAGAHTGLQCSRRGAIADRGRGVRHDDLRNHISYCSP